MGFDFEHVQRSTLWPKRHLKDLKTVWIFLNKCAITDTVSFFTKYQTKQWIGQLYGIFKVQHENMNDDGFTDIRNS